MHRCRTLFLYGRHYVDAQASHMRTMLSVGYEHVALRRALPPNFAKIGEARSMVLCREVKA